jgi:hypothetical protein
MTNDKIELTQRFKEVSTDDPKKMTDEDFQIIWARECNFFHNRLLTGEKKHYCREWDYMPIDETCEFEFEICSCDLEKNND